MRTDWPDSKVALPPPHGRRAPDTGILAEITAGVSAGTDLHGLLGRFLAPIMQIAGARAGAVRVLSDDGDRLQMISEVGLPAHVVDTERNVNPDCGTCGSAFAGDTIVSAADMGYCARHGADSYFGQEVRQMMAVPLTYRGRVLGLYNLFFDAQPAVEADSSALFKSIGELLGLALHNALLERDTLRAAVLSERQAMAAEVHDSIAQTLAFAKMRMPLLQEAVSTHDETQALRYCADVRQALSSVHSNLREVLAHFRAPMDPLGLKHALHAAVAEFRELARVDLVLDDRVPGLQLSTAQEFQVLRIVQEALANITKHARARHAWLTLGGLGGVIDVTIEDDGAGLLAASGSDDGSHYGLDIMRQRATSLGGTLEVSPREGGGTRVCLRFPAEFDGTAAR